MNPTIHSASVALLGVALFGLAPLVHRAQEGPPAKGPAAAEKAQQIHCHLDLSSPGRMSDIVSNALYGGLGIQEAKVVEYLDGARSTHATGDELLAAAAAHFDLPGGALEAEVERYRHCNCVHPPMFKGQITAWRGDAGAGRVSDADAPSEPLEVTQFAKDVTLHVVLHELAHALVREFDLPVLANEEALADAFATCYLTAELPDRAFDVIRARTQSLMIEANEVPRAEWGVNGEHNSDARRAFQIAALAVAADESKYRPIAEEVGLSADDIRRATDYGTEVHRSWRRLLRDYRMPAGAASKESRLRRDEGNPFLKNLCEGGLADELQSALQAFDWHSTITIHLRDAEGGAAWSRSKRTITVNSEYVRRFVTQGKSRPR